MALPVYDLIKRGMMPAYAEATARQAEGSRNDAEVDLTLPLPTFHSIPHHQGYITLLAVLIIGTIGSVISITLLTLGLSASRTSSSFERATLARALSETCVEIALRQITTLTSFSGTASSTLGQGNCSYTVTQPTASSRLIATTSTIGSVIRKMNVNLNINTTPGQPIVSIVSWQEIP